MREVDSSPKAANGVCTEVELPQRIWAKESKISSPSKNVEGKVNLLLKEVENLVADSYEIGNAITWLNIAMNALDHAIIAMSKVEYDNCEDLLHCAKIKECENEIAVIQAKLISDHELRETLLADVKKSVME